MATGVQGSPAGWHRTDTSGQAGPFHARRVPEPARPLLWLHRVTQPALVLGSTQSAALVDHAAAARRGLEVTRRRSGGGLVLVHPDHARWLDVVLPAGHPLWDDDISHASLWLGRAWSRAVAGVLGEGAPEVACHRGPLLRTRWSDLICFAGRGPGEVTVGPSKVVGISQRRTRGWARFQCLVLDRSDLDLVAAVVHPEARPGPVEELLALPIGHPLDLDAAVSAVLALLEEPVRPSGNDDAH